MKNTVSKNLLAGVLFALMLLAGAGTKAQLYWNTNGVSNTLTATNWSATGIAPFTTAWTNSSNIIFSANSAITYVTLTPVGNLTITGASTVNWTAAGTYTTGAAVKTFDIAAGAVLNWNSQAVSSAGSGFIKNGGGTWNIAAQANPYTGGFTMNAGTVTFTGNNAFGAGTLVLNGGTITPANATARTFTNAVTIGGNFQIGDITNVAAGTGNVTFSGTVALGAATRTITIGAAGTYTFSGVVSGGAGAGLTVASTSTGRIVLSNAANTYSGATTVNSGILQAGVANSLPATTALVFANNATAQLISSGAGFNTTVGSIAGGGATGGNIVMGANSLTTGGDNISTSYGGVISGTGATFTKNGTGTQTLTGANTYTGTTTVNSGGLLVNGSTSSLSAVTVANGATLGGSGTVAGTVAVNGTIAPGSAGSVTGTLNTGATTFGANSNYKFEISNVAGTQGGASGWDFLNSSGAINVTASPINIQLTGVGATGFVNNNAYTWVLATGTSIVGFNAANFTVSVSGTIAATGTFAVEQSGNSIQVVYTPPSGNTITLSPATQLNGASFCNGASGNVITLTYITSGTVTAPAIELSNSAGSFLSGTVQLAGTITAGSPNSITGTVPGATAAGANYRVRIISADAIPVASGDNGFNITITNAVVPAVSIAITTGTNPSCSGNSITFTATPTNGGGTPGYQWKKNGTDIGGQTAATYTTTTLVSGDIISCAMTSSVSCVTALTVVSSGITVTINPLPANPANPTAVGTNPSCGPNTLNSMTADPNTTFYWQGTVNNGQSTANPATGTYAVSTTGTYYVTSQSTNGCWSAASGSIALTINTAPAITVQPVDKSIAAGANTSFSVTATNAASYQWQVDQGSGFADVVNGGVYAGATTSTLSLTAVPIGYNNYVYQCIVRGGGCADLVSSPAILGVNPVPWEDFETGTKAAYGIANVTCTAGSWSFNNALLGTSASDYFAGLQSARININGDITMNFNVVTLGVVKLNHRVFSGDLNSTWRLQASTDNGVTWTAYTSAIFTSTSTVQTETILINLLGNVRFRIVNLETSGNHRINIDDIYVTSYTGCTTPTAQATYTSATSILSTSLTINFGAGAGGAGRIVVVKQGSPVTGFPTSGVNYIPGSSNFAAALPTIATNEKVVYNGSGTSVNVTGLSPNTTYYFEIFEYSGTNCYLVSNVSNTGSATTACNTPATAASAVTASAVTTTTATLTWANGSGSNRLVVVSGGAPVGGIPVDGTSYSVNSSYSVAPAFAPGNGKTVYNSTSNTVSLTNLASNTIYYVSVFEFNSASNCYLAIAGTTTFTTGSLVSDIISAGGENSCISSIVNGTIATVANGTQVWQFMVRDGGAVAPDADGLPTIVNSIVITQGTGNTATDWTNIQAAALFDGSTLVASGVITGTTITFTGAPLLTVADNADKTLSLRITLKAAVSNPATIDGKIFRFSITPANITLAGSGTSGKNTSAAVATSDAAMDAVCVVATKLVYSTQPSTTGQNLAMSPNVVVKAYDVNNNLDLNFNQSVSITSTAGAGLVGTPLSVTAISGTATFTSIKHSATGVGFVMTATSAGVSNATSASYNITTVTTFFPGDFAILAVNNSNTNGVDEIAFVVFKDILANTSFFMTDNGYERVNAGKWGTSEGIVQMTYTGAGNGGLTIPAGTIFVVQGNNTSFTILKCGASDNANWTINPNVLTSGSFNINNSDQVWFTQGGAWTSASGSLTGHDAVTSGNVLYGWSGIDWKTNIGNTTPTWTTQGSRVYPQMSCFSTNLSQSTDLGRTKYVGATTATTRLGWITRINDKTNWATYASNALYDAAAPVYASNTLCNLVINPGVPVDGKWTGAKNTDWFDCSNWDTREVPTAAMSVTISSANATNDCVVDNVTNAVNAVQYGNAANCFDLTVDGRKLSTGNATDVINVNGNFKLQNTATLDMTGGGTFNLQSGSWTKVAGSTFTSGTGTVSYNGPLSQTIVAEDYNNLTSTSTGARVLAAAGTIGITGAFTPGTNVYTNTTSTIDFKGTNQNIPAFVYNNLTLSNSGTKTLTGDADVQADLTINNSVNFSLANNYLNLKSTATQTARVAPVAATATISYPGTGRFVAERYYLPKRAWRLITAPVTAEASGTLFNSWQVGGATPIGVGTYISGPGETAANGLDVTPQHNYSLKTFNQLTSGFDGVSNTKTTRISGITGTPGTPDNVGYFIFIRGDRTPANINAFNTGLAIVETTLKDTGKIQVQNYTFPANPSVGANKYTLIGNPYVSPVDFASVTKNNVANKFQVWDPNLGTVGAYVVFDMALGTPVPAGSSQTQIIQAHQAFLVETTNSTAPSVSFNEAAKSSVNNLNLFRPVRTAPVLIANLHLVQQDGSTQLADGVLAQFSNEYSAGADAQDAMKFANINETFSILHNNNSFILERRPLLKDNDTLFFSLKKTRQLNYRFNIRAEQFAAANLKGYLVDTYKKTTTPVNMQGADTWIDFAVTADAASAASNRFYMIFKKAAGFNHIHANMLQTDVAVNWQSANDADIASYEVERSTDGESFEKVATTMAQKNPGTEEYSSLDLNPAPGIYYYRVKAITHSGAYGYSESVKVKVVKVKSQLYVYPNPVTDGQIGLQMSTLPAGTYHVRLLGTAGQVLLSRKIQHAASTATEMIAYPSTITAGTYQLEVTGADKTTSVVNVVIVR